MHAVTGPYAHAIFEGELGAADGHRRQRNAAARFRRPSSRSEPDLRQGPLRPDDVAAGARLRRGLRRRRRPQHDHRPRHVRDAVGLAGDPRRQRASRAGLCRKASRASPARCRPAPPPTASRRSSASAPTRRRPAGSSSATCSTPASRRSAARRASAPAPNHIREKDGVWAVLFWLNILARRRMLGRATSCASTGATYGRNYYTRHDYDEVDLAAAQGLMAALREATATLPGKTLRRADRRGGRRLRLSRSGRRTRIPTIRACG